MVEVQRMAGVLVALASPLRSDGGVDEPATGRLVEHVLAGGVNGLLALGSTGETASLDEPSRRKVLAAVVRAAAGRLPVLCGVAQPQLPRRWPRSRRRRAWAPPWRLSSRRSTTR